MAGGTPGGERSVTNIGLVPSLDPDACQRQERFVRLKCSCCPPAIERKIKEMKRRDSIAVDNTELIGSTIASPKTSHIL